VGISNANAVANNQCRSSYANGWGYWSTEQNYNNATGSAYGASFTTNDVLAVLLIWMQTTCFLQK
jgi:hypothetical protein